MENEVRRALFAMGFTDEQIFLEGTPLGNVGGFIISPRFSGQSQMARQDAFWDELGRYLSADDLRRVVSILTMTPEEVDDDVQAVA